VGQIHRGKSLDHLLEDYDIILQSCFFYFKVRIVRFLPSLGSPVFDAVILVDSPYSLVANVIDISIAYDVILVLGKRPLRERQSKITWLGQGDINDGLTLFVVEFWTASTVFIFRFKNFESYFIESMNNIAHIIATKSKIVGNLRNLHFLSRCQNDLGALNSERII
jgi:hypothetical protein